MGLAGNKLVVKRFFRASVVDPRFGTFKFCFLKLNVKYFLNCDWLTPTLHLTLTGILIRVACYQLIQEWVQIPFEHNLLTILTSHRLSDLALAN